MNSRGSAESGVTVLTVDARLAVKVNYNWMRALLSWASVTAAKSDVKDNAPIWQIVTRLWHPGFKFKGPIPHGAKRGSDSQHEHAATPWGHCQ